MLDGLLKSGFSSKCKSLIKATRTRIEVVRRRAEAKQRFLKEDLVKLLANGLDINAYGRTDEFLTGLNLLTCYDFIEYSCGYVVKRLSAMQKQRECPEECREAVASLMFAAARFSDLPELRDLRDLFQERYGGSLECFVNKKLVEILSSRSSITEKRLELLKDIASEFSIMWDSKGFEQRMAAPSTFAQAQSNKHGPSTLSANKYDLNGNGSVTKSDGYNVSPKEAYGLSSGGHRLHNDREGKDSRTENGSVAVVNSDSYDVLPKETLAISTDAHRMHNGREGKDPRREDVSVAVAKSDRYTVSPKEKPGLSNDGHRTHNGRKGKNSRQEEVDLHQKAWQGRSTDGNMPQTKKAESNSRRVNNDNLYDQKQEVMVVKHELLRKKDDTLLKAVKSGTSSCRKGLDKVTVGHEYSGISNIHDVESLEALSHGRTKLPPNMGGFLGKNEDISSAHEHVTEKNLENSNRTVQEKDADSLKSYQDSILRPPPYIKSKKKVLPPPYVKHTDGKHRPSRKSERAGSYCDEQYMDPSSCTRDNEVNGSNSIQREPDHHEHDGQNIGPVRARNYDGKEQYNLDDKIFLPKPRSVRRKQHKSSLKHDDMSHLEDAGTLKRRSGSKRRENSRKGSQIFFDGEHSRKDEEERMIDKLLLHYSKKPSTYDAGDLRKISQAHQSHQINNDSGDSSHDHSRDGHNLSPNAIPTTIRSISLPHEETMPSDAKKVFTRANSFQPDGQARHVHPKLPDYDDLAARFAAMKGQ